jgi:hypothetical protein
MDTLHGTWLHETSYEGMQMQTYQTIQPNGHYGNADTLHYARRLSSAYLPCR